MKILIVNALYPPLIFGGAEKSVALLAEGLNKAGNLVSVISLHDSIDVKKVRVNGVEVIRIPIFNIYWPYGQSTKRNLLEKLIWHAIDSWNPWTRKLVGALIDEIKPDVIHTNNIRGLSTAIWSAARSRKIPVVHTLRDYSIACNRGGMFKRARNCDKQCLDCALVTALKKKSSSKINLVVGNSHFILSRHKKIGFFEDIISMVIFNIGGAGLDLKKEVREKGVLRFGFIGRLESMKGIEILLKATEKVESQEWELYLAGSGNQEYIDFLRSTYINRNIKWLGFVCEDEFFAQIDVCIVPSIWEEPLPRAAIEALKHKKAIIYSQSGGNTEVCSFAKLSKGYPPMDSAALAEIIEGCLREIDVWKSCGGFASSEGEAEFSEPSIVSRYTNAYTGAIAASKVKSK